MKIVRSSIQAPPISVCIDTDAAPETWVLLPHSMGVLSNYYKTGPRHVGVAFVSFRHSAILQ
jgi:hypothetical protein